MNNHQFQREIHFDLLFHDHFEINEYSPLKVTGDPTLTCLSKERASKASLTNLAALTAHLPDSLPP